MFLKLDNFNNTIVEQIFPRLTWCSTNLQYQYLMFIGYPDSSDPIQLSLKSTSRPSQKSPPPSQIPTIYSLMQRQECLVFMLHRPSKVHVMARLKHHVAIDYLSSALFFLNSFREKFRCHARLHGYQGKGVIASSPCSLLTFAVSFLNIN